MAREAGLNEGIRAMFSAGLGGAIMKVGGLEVEDEMF